jgi:hypothetical protein
MIPNPKFGTASPAGSLTTSYLATAVEIAELPSPLSAVMLYGVTLRVSAIAAGATNLTVLVSTDAAGDVLLVPPTVCPIGVAMTTATKGAAALRCEFPISLASRTLYVCAKTDVGTATLDTVIVSATVGQ